MAVNRNLYERRGPNHRYRADTGRFITGGYPLKFYFLRFLTLIMTIQYLISV